MNCFYRSMTNDVGFLGFMVKYIGLAGTQTATSPDELAETTLFEKHGAYLSHVTTNLANSGQEVQRSHPFFCAQSCFPSKIMKVGDQAIEDVSEARIRTLGIDADSVLGDVVNGQVLHWRYLGF